MPNSQEKSLPSTSQLATVSPAEPTAAPAQDGLCGQRGACEPLRLPTSTLVYRRRALEVAVDYSSGAPRVIPVPQFESSEEEARWRTAAHLYVPEWGGEKSPHGRWTYRRHDLSQHAALGAK